MRFFINEYLSFCCLRTFLLPILKKFNTFCLYNMDEEYYQLTSELDPREILRYLNDLGIHNVSGEVLKYFISDLKKLIKYDLRNKSKDKINQEEFDIQWSERLHSASTYSSRVKSKSNSGPITCSKDCFSARSARREINKVHNIHSAPNLGILTTTDKPLRRACSCIRVEKKPEAVKEKDKASAVSSNNLIKVQKVPVKKKCDPVSLYHYYTSLWAKYKPNVPGENDWSELRWSVRQKMAGNVPKMRHKVSNLQTQDKELKK